MNHAATETQSIDPVGRTSLLVAAMRAAESERGDAEGRLMSDPYARGLAGPDGFSLLDDYRAKVGDISVIPLRTRYMDDKASQALARGVRQVVILAAGMDARAYRFHFPEGTALFEVDRREVLERKEVRLSGARPQCLRRAVGADLREAWDEALLKAGLDRSKPVLWLVEGLLVYLDEDAVPGLFSRIDALSPSGSVILFDALSRRLLESPFMKKSVDFMKDLGAPWRYGVDEPEALMTRLGWLAEACEPGDVEPSRWPFPRAPRHVPGVPRSFFVEARKP